MVFKRPIGDDVDGLITRRNPLSSRAPPAPIENCKAAPDAGSSFLFCRIRDSSRVGRQRRRLGCCCPCSRWANGPPTAPDTPLPPPTVLRGSPSPSNGQKGTPHLLSRRKSAFT